jgi:hypothetical protein
VKPRNHEKQVEQLCWKFFCSQKDEAKFVQEDEDDQVLLIYSYNLQQMKMTTERISGILKQQKK